MKIVANIQVGNEADLIDHHIAYHLALGIDGFVIADLDSTDGTSERLDRYRNDPRFVIRHYTMDKLITASGPKTAEVGQWMLQTARDHFAPDWVVRLDADEFLYPARSLASAVLALGVDASFKITRRNAVFGKGQPIPPIPTTKDKLAEFSIVAHPVKVSDVDYRADDSLPLILTEVGPKVIVRPDLVAAYTTGGHATIDAHGKTQAASAADGLLLVHFWFSTAERFVRKARFTAFVKHLLREHPKASRGWQWTRWAEIAGAGDPESTAEILWEYHRQFLSAETLGQLRQLGHVCRVSEYWET
ncbi:glycosyltransferase family 2 protein [Affinirhizobium pseudoryzae]|uniref:glycosyltransferase family 2 protein n=1 Tax=Allorhizobium pseudoryzae TaxID=379684 RepID=UPI0013ECE81E|nr:glycosyltransferase family 2 protein [Allorhizobium pseudoryzae]